MNEAYRILGAERSESDETIKEKYRSLAQKYSPDKYRDNPLSSLAEEKMRAINEAFDAIMAERRGNKEAAEKKATAASNVDYSEIRRMVRSGHIEDAEVLLGAIAENDRDAEWHFLKGTVFYSKGWLEDATMHFSESVRQDPTNREYKEAHNRIMQSRNGGYRGGPGNMGGSSCSVCDICTALICADMCCDCGPC